jgi:hypothetical protein
MRSMWQLLMHPHQHEAAVKRIEDGIALDTLEAEVREAGNRLARELKHLEGSMRMGAYEARLAEASKKTA